MLGNLAVVRSIDAHCGYQDDQVEVLCLNVAKQFNVDDAQKLRDLTRPGVTALVSDVDTASTLHRQPLVQGVTLGRATVVVAPFESCRGTCTSRIHIVRAP